MDLTARRPSASGSSPTPRDSEPRLTIRRGVKVTGLLDRSVGDDRHAARRRRPHRDGEELRADLVVDAIGRQSRGPHGWPRSARGRRTKSSADSGFAYYTRYFRGTQPQRRGPVLTPIGTISILTLPGDNGTWSVTIFTATGDQPLKACGTRSHGRRSFAPVRCTRIGSTASRSPTCSP